MSERETILLIEDIGVSIANILEFTQGMSFEEYESDLKTKHAVERNFEVIGEASSRVPENYKVETSQIEWRILKDFRNFIIHEYFGINDLIIWDTIQQRLPDLLEAFKILLNKFEQSQL
ncbi:MAG: HepT-like ribonuclease domain-containing protein [Ginsengibacter sp.]